MNTNIKSKTKFKNQEYNIKNIIIIFYVIQVFYVIHFFKLVHAKMLTYYLHSNKKINKNEQNMDYS